MHINYASSSGLKTASAQITTQPGSLMGVDLKRPVSGSTSLIIYDSENSSTGGKTVLAIVEADAGMSPVGHEYFAPVVANRGIYVEVAGTGVSFSYVIRYAL